jgi:hypothetical protein
MIPFKFFIIQLLDLFCARVMRHRPHALCNLIGGSRWWDATLWIVGQHTGAGWEFQGLFATEEQAVGACRASSYFVAPARLGEHLPHESHEWIGAYYPLAAEEDCGA